MSRLVWVLGVFVAATASTAEAGHPFLSLFTKQTDGPYAPSTGRYVVVDPAPVGGGFPVAGHHSAAAADRVLWERHDLNRPTYPYGWFGAAMHTTQRWTNGGYYDNYVEGRALRGR